MEQQLKKSNFSFSDPSNPANPNQLKTDIFSDIEIAGSRAREDAGVEKAHRDET